MAMSSLVTVFKLLKGFWKKYISYGDFSGTVKLSGLSGQDIEELEGFFGKIHTKGYSNHSKKC